MNATRGIVGVLLLVAGAAPAWGQGDAAAGRAAYPICAACHGQNGEGNQALNAPAIAGQSAAYLARQLNNFRTSARGSHADDAAGQQMRPMALSLANEAAVNNVAAYVASLEPQAATHSGVGTASAGSGQYGVCAACHGAQGEGNDVMGAPRLDILQDWYVVRQIQNYQRNIRGAASGDTFGAQMKGMAMTLSTPAAIDNVAAYIATFR